MAHTIQIGNTSSDPKELDKVYSLGNSITVNLKHPCSVINPTFELDYNASYASCNYLYFGEWGRYYFIDDIVMKPGNKCELNCTVDPLMSFNNELKILNVLVERNEYARNSLLVDEAYPNPVGYELYQMLFPNNLPGYVSGRNFVLEIVGGGS